ncbi:MAG: amino acid racemase [Armatimonadota bacterium]|nr:amino acid racemase [Armatimonadota bacterium]MDR7449448.1 amino acid racemase [Armatimonadota bacterium]MDR7458821.1 amino acid racemase [Armatimonadota bacterium]MDR7480037.1 amino acid racemase [Armatimonadota bacterium]MDR7488453.1 amino acid racemase [Armatimonadota bacterium]
MPRTIGVLGGLGPWATLYFFEQILRLTPAERDQDYLRVVIDNNPAIPDRTPAILAGGEDPVPALVATARNLQRAGAEVIAIPCNTAHAFYPAVAAAVEVPVLHIMGEVARAIRQRYPETRRVGLLATRGTVATGLYPRALAPACEVLVPPAEEQETVDRLIYAIKAQRADGRLRQEAVAVARRLVERGAALLILGCTELPLALAQTDLPVPTLDSTQVLAAAAVREALQGEDPVPGRAASPAAGRSVTTT